MYEMSDKAKAIREKLLAFMDTHVYPAEAVYKEQQAGMESRWAVQPIMNELKAKARAEGLWNLFLHDAELGGGLFNLDYAPLCEIMGRSPIAPEVFNCSAPDTGNMETLYLFGSDEQKAEWLTPLLAGEIRSCFSMTEPDIASSDATNIRTEIRLDGNEYVVSGRKWW